MYVQLVIPCQDIRPGGHLLSTEPEESCTNSSCTPAAAVAAVRGKQGEKEMDWVSWPWSAAAYGDEWYVGVVESCKRAGYVLVRGDGWVCLEVWEDGPPFHTCRRVT